MALLKSGKLVRELNCLQVQAGLKVSSGLCPLLHKVAKGRTRPCCIVLSLKLLWRLRQEDKNFKAFLGYKLSLR